MPLGPHSRLGPYEILGPLGAGGMGEVYRARDTRLERLVAIKALPDAFARDPNRLARFQREARLLASLMHPNIAAIHGLEESDGVPYLVLEYVEGETLADRLMRGPLAVRETLEIGMEIAAALEAAHARGVVHRDLKPGNVMLTPAGKAKVLDFGLAKSTAGEPATNLTASPTISAMMTADGFVLGTAAYMSPEQARGKDVDERADIWSFGCVLYECLSGQQPFRGETVSDLIVQILTVDPAWSALPPATPPRLRDIVYRCLRKEAGERSRDAGELRRELTALAASASPARAASGGSGPVAAAAPPSLAVLYFENLSRDPDSDYFCDGITEDILTDLSKIKGLRVASRTAVARFRGKDADALQVANELGVGAVLEGSVRRAGERVRISAQLVNAADGFHLWAERYDRTLQDVFAVQEEIASAIAQALRVTLTPAEAEDLVRDRPEDARAYDLYLKGREFYERRTPESFRYAIDLFQQALAIDPRYARAWAGIADCYGQLLQSGAADDKAEAARFGLEAARRASAIDPRLPEAYKAEALVLGHSGDSEGNRQALYKALEVNPRFVPALVNLAVEALARADAAAAERFARRATEADPAHSFALDALISTLLVTNRNDEAYALTDRLRRLSRESFYVTEYVVIRVAVDLRRGDVAGARRELREGRVAGGREADLRVVEAVIAATDGDVETARHLFAEVEASQEISGWATNLSGWLGGLLHEEERLARYVTRSGDDHFMQVVARLEPEMHALLDYPPFAPRLSPLTLVWPAEAPPVPESVRALYTDVRFESGWPQATDLVPVR